MTGLADDHGLTDDPVTDTSVFRLAESVRYLAAMIDRLIPTIKNATVQHQYTHPLPPLPPLLPPLPPPPHYTPYQYSGVAAQGVSFGVKPTTVTNGTVSS